MGPLIYCCGFLLLVNHVTPTTIIAGQPVILWANTAQQAKQTRVEVIPGDPHKWFPRCLSNRGCDSLHVLKINASLDTNAFTAVAADHSDDAMLVANGERRQIERRQLVPFDPTTVETIAHTSGQVPGVSVDWLNKNIYWVDTAKGSLEMASYAQQGKHRIVHRGHGTPTALATDPRNGHMYWSVYVDGHTSIRRSDLLGVEPYQNILQGRQRVSALEVDATDGTLYFLEEGRDIYRYSPGGGGPPTRMDVNPNNGSFVDFALYKDWMLVSKGESMSFFLHNLTSDKYVGLLTSKSDDRRPTSIAVSAVENQPTIARGSGGCAEDNGGCQHFCVGSSAKTHQCGCKYGYRLTSDGKGCASAISTIPDAFLLVVDSAHRDIYMLDLGVSPRVGAIPLPVLGVSPRVGAIPLPVSANPAAAVYGQRKKRVYWADEQNRSIAQTTKRVSSDVWDTTEIYSWALAGGQGLESRGRGLAHDETHDRLYFAASTTIAWVEPTTGHHHVVIRTWQQTRVIVLDTSRRIIYWSQCGDTCSILRADMDTGQSQSTIVDALPSVHGMVLDRIARKLYWTNDGLVECSETDGLGRVTVLSREGSTFSGIALDSQHLFITDLHSRSLLVVDKATKRETRGGMLRDAQFFGELRGIHLYNATALATTPNTTTPTSPSTTTPTTPTSPPTTTPMSPPTTTPTSPPTTTPTSPPTTTPTTPPTTTPRSSHTTTPSLPPTTTSIPTSSTPPTTPPPATPTLSNTTVPTLPPTSPVTASSTPSSTPATLPIDSPTTASPTKLQAPYTPKHDVTVIIIIATVVGTVLLAVIIVIGGVLCVRRRGPGGDSGTSMDSFRDYVMNHQGSLVAGSGTLSSSTSTRTTTIYQNR